MIIFEELVYQEAERRKVGIPAEKLNRAEAEFRKQFNSPDQYQQYLQAEMRGSEQQLRQQMRRSLRKIVDRCKAKESPHDCPLVHDAKRTSTG